MARVPTPPVLDVPALPGPVRVVGDVHLAEEGQAVAGLFARTLGELEGAGGSLVILGDLFNAWSGSAQAHEPFERLILDRLRRLEASGVKLVFVPGNRDFNFPLGVDLAITSWPDLVRMPWGDRTVLFTHGDRLCLADHGYQRLRQFLRRADGRPRLWSRLCPYGIQRGIARGLRQVSRVSTAKKPRMLMDIDYEAAAAWLDHYGADVLIAGHVHTGVHTVLAPGPAGERRESFVLLDWDRGGSVVVLDDTGVRMVAPGDAERTGRGG